MKTFRLVHVLSEFEVCTITLTETEISMDPTVPREDYWRNDDYSLWRTYRSGK